MARRDDAGEGLGLLTLADVADTIQQDPRRTIQPPLAAADTARRAAVAALHEIAGLPAGSAARLELGATLGAGGMGVVRAATQVGLGRQVAVKALRADQSGDLAVSRLLTEAWVTGSLEHPNVVPIYDLGLDADGRPLIVLKRIEGVHWGGLMHDAAAVRKRFREDDLLEWNLRILMQVCRAVHFAHSRGIIHRDLKPENVMVGEFGEVYVLDWGIAVSLRDDGTGRIPLAASAGDIAGTPGYMAPEMLGGTGDRLSERTDVYLLGAILYEILAGDPPHDGDRVEDIVRSIRRSEPELPDAPAELSRIVRRAMAADPDARFENAEQVRLALDGHLHRRGAARLAEQAERRLAALLDELAAGAADPARRLRIYGLFAECRFGFRAALEAWRGNQVARDGLRRAIEAMADHELAQGEPRAAAALLAELDEAPPALAARVEAATRAHDAERRRVDAIAADADPRTGVRTRFFLGALLCLMWTVAPLAVELFLTGHETVARSAMVPAGFLILMLGMGRWARETLHKTAFNRKVSAVGLLIPSTMLVLHAGGYLLGLDVQRVLVLQMFGWFMLAAISAATLEARLAPSALGYLGLALAAARWPGLLYFFMAASNLVLMINLAVIWHPARTLGRDWMRRR